MSQKKSMWWSQMEWALKSNATRILLWGPPGTGKTYQACQQGNFHRSTLHAGSTPDDFVGGWRLKTDGKGGTSTEWVDGCAVTAMKRGEVLVLDEIDHAGMEIISTLHAILDDPSLARLSTGDGVVVPSRGYRVIATMNGNPSDLAPALLDRFDAVIHAKIVHERALDSLPSQLRKLCLGVADAERHWVGAITPRTVQSYQRLVTSGVPIEVAATMCWGEASSDVLTSIGMHEGN